MLTSNNKLTIYHYAVVLLWLISVIVAASYFMKQRATQFDPNQLLLGVENGELLKGILSDSFNKNIELTAPTNTLFHLYSDNCKCNTVTNNHMKSVFTLAKNNQFSVIHMPITSEMKQYIPSSPAVLVTDEIGDLLYFGPYGQGVACSKSNGIVDIVLNNFFNGFKFASIHSKATGCYCNLS